MKIFSRKSLILKIALILAIVILFNFIAPRIVLADDNGGVGGILFEPIKDLLLTIGDAIMNLMQNVIFRYRFHTDKN